MATSEQLADLAAIEAAVARLRASLQPTATADLSSTLGGATASAVGTLSPISVSDAPVLTHEPLNLSRVVCVDSWHASSRYERGQNFARWIGAAASVRAIAINLAAGGARLTFGASRYVLLVDDAEVSAVDGTLGANEIRFTFDITTLPEGWRRLRIGGLATGETMPTWFAYLDRGGPKPALMPVCTGSYDVTHNDGSAVHSWGWVPSVGSPTLRPLPPRDYPPTTLRGPHIAVPLVPGDGGNINRPSVSQHGVSTTFNTQSYYWADFIKRYPVVHLLDGPRGVGTAGMVTHISIGTGRREDRPDSPLMLNVYATDPWRLMRIADDGAVTTLLGWRHKGPPGHWQDKAPSPQLELVGDWSAVPPERRGCWELWGMAWDQYSLKVDNAAEPIPEEAGRRPHLGNPVCFLADSQWNRVLRAEFDGRSHRTPAKVTEFLTGLGDPWDVVTWGDEVVVSERTQHRIVAYKLDGTFSRVIVERDPTLPGSAVVDRNRFVLRIGPLSDLQAQPCVAPEGLYVLGDWLYYGSYAQALVQRIHLVTGERQRVCAPTIDGNSKYVKLAVSDGTFGPEGTVFVDSWSNAWNARADKRCFLPDGTPFDLPSASPIEAGAYGSAVAVGGGRLYLGTSEEGVKRISARLPTDPVMTATWTNQVRAGYAQYQRANHRLLHGPHGYGHWGWLLPWGQSPDIDAYLVAAGHNKD